MTALYTSGTISLVNGSAVINGIGTAWETALIVGGTVHVEAEGNPLPILPDDSTGANEHPITDTQMTAAITWQGASGTYNYALVRENTYTSQQAANAVATAELLRRLNNPTIAALAGVQAEQDHLILLTGASTATIIPRSSLIQGIDANASVETPADLEAYESEETGFIVLVADAGDERAALYFKLSATAGDWSVPAYLTGGVGPKGDTGKTGLQWRGEWINTAAYVLNDVVRSNRSVWIALRANTNVPPPVLPTLANADWELFAPAGANGTGTGDVVGPVGAVAINQVAGFGATDGKSLVGLTAAEIRSAAAVVWEPIVPEVNLGGASNAIFTLPAGYKEFEIRLRDFNPTTASTNVVCRLSFDNGATYKQGAADYHFNRLRCLEPASMDFAAADGTYMALTPLVVAAGGRGQSVFTLHPGSSSEYPHVFGRANTFTPNGQETWHFGARYMAGTLRATNIMLFLTGGTFITGYVQILGRR